MEELIDLTHYLIYASQCPIWEVNNGIHSR